jgi:excisionase family DNA binding protein
MITSKPVYTLNEVAELLGVSRASVNRFAKSGRLRVAKLGHRTIRVSDEALRDFLRSEEIEQPATRRERAK